MRYLWLTVPFLIILLLTYVFLTVFQRAEEVSAGWEMNDVRNESNEFRVMTFNIHHGMGFDEKLDLDRIAQLIVNEEVDLVSLNEIDRYLPRSKMVDQIKVLGDKMEMNRFFSSTLNFGIGQYGNGVLARFPIINPMGKKLPKFLNREQRGMIEFTTFFNDQEIQVIILHLGLNPVERQKQLDFLSKKVLEVKIPLIIMGDFNINPTAPVMQKFLKETDLNVNSFEPTFPADNPDLKIDYILTSQEWEVVEELKPISTLASDHLPLVGTFRLR